MLIVEAGNPKEAQATALLQASHALMQDLFDADENHFLSVDELTRPGIHFFIAREDGDILGTGALAEKDGYGEVKALFVDPKARGRGVARALLRQIEDQARDLGLDWLRLETGDKLFDALRLYRAAGFSNCGPFGDYTANESSVFMEKHLA